MTSAGARDHAGVAPLQRVGPAAQRVDRAERRRIGAERQQLGGTVQRVDHPRRDLPVERRLLTLGVAAPHQRGRDDERDGQRDPERRRRPGLDEPHGDRAEHGRPTAMAIGRRVRR